MHPGTSARLNFAHRSATNMVQMPSHTASASPASPAGEGTTRCGTARRAPAPAPTTPSPWGAAAPSRGGSRGPFHTPRTSAKDLPSGSAPSPRPRRAGWWLPPALSGRLISPAGSLQQFIRLCSNAPRSVILRIIPNTFNDKHNAGSLPAPQQSS